MLFNELNSKRTYIEKIGLKPQAMYRGLFRTNNDDLFSMKFPENHP